MIIFQLWRVWGLLITKGRVDKTALALRESWLGEGTSVQPAEEQGNGHGMRWREAPGSSSEEACLRRWQVAEVTG